MPRWNHVVSLYGNLCGYASQGEKLLTAILLKLCLFLIQFVGCVAESLGTFALQTVNDGVEVLHGEASDEALCARYVLCEEVPDDLRVAGAHHQTEHVLLVCVLLFLGILAVAADEEEDDESHECNLGNNAAVIHYDADNCAGNERLHLL